MAQRSSDFEVIQRVVTVLKFLVKPRTRYDVAEHLGLHDRTAYRLLQALIGAKLVAVVEQSTGLHKTTYQATKKLTPA